MIIAVYVLLEFLLFDCIQVINFISQMDLLRFLTENIYLLQTRGLANKTLLDLGLGRNRVYFVRSGEKVSRAKICRCNDTLGNGCDCRKEV